MGKPYSSELAQLGDTYRWALTADLNGLDRAISHVAPHCLLAVGSGGSLSVAEFAVGLHEIFSGRMAKTATPVAIGASPLPMFDLALLFLSAGGRNPDILGAFQRALLREPRHVCVLTGTPGSQLALRAADFEWVNTVAYQFPFGNDGFLATNSLVAFGMLLVRAYQTAFGSPNQLPARLEILSDCIRLNQHPISTMAEQTASLWERRTLVVLYGPTSSAAAVDIESRFTEAALGSVQTADYRNFAHGRHHWLAKRAHETAVLALVTNDDRQLANETLAMVQRAGAPIARVDIQADGTAASLAALLVSLQLAGVAGQAHRIDPGRPGVPTYGRQIYNAQTLKKGYAQEQRNADTTRPIERKSGLATLQMQSAGTLRAWQEAQARFVSRLAHTRFRGIVLDYDGTLCQTEARYAGWSGEAPREISRLLTAGVPVGIATGRGASVRDDLRRELPEQHWRQVFVGYHNGAEIAYLSEDAAPEESQQPTDELRPIAAVIAADDVLMKLALCSIGKHQISLRPRRPSDDGVVWTVAGELLQRLNASPRVCLVRSGHSVDIIAPAVSKRCVVEHMRGSSLNDSATSPILCIGDQGAWPGNDGTLLTEPLSLSSDEVSRDPTTCWNLARAGVRGVQATVAYLRALEVQQDGTFCLRLGALRRTVSRA